MDYKYIEQLLERYWECETSPEEESILRSFFSQKNVPDSLVRYKELFVYEQQQGKLSLGEDFDKRVTAAIGLENTSSPADPRTVKAAHITLSHRLRPLYRAAAVVAIVTLVGTAAQHSFTKQNASAGQGWDYNQSAYKDSYSDPDKAYEATEDILMMFKKGAQTAVADSTHNKADVTRQKAPIE